MGSRGWKVWLDRKIIDIVFFDDDIKEHEQVRKSLIEHDGYDPKIVVTKTKKKQALTDSKIDASKDVNA